MDWEKYDDIKILNALDGGSRAEIWARGTFYACFGGFLILAVLIIIK